MGSDDFDLFFSPQERVEQETLLVASRCMAAWFARLIGIYHFDGIQDRPRAIVQFAQPRALTLRSSLRLSRSLRSSPPFPSKSRPAISIVVVVDDIEKTTPWYKHRSQSIEQRFSESQVSNHTVLMSIN